jgi:decaprenylphospho-beta-D-ribofuranose 2-oxidase
VRAVETNVSGWGRYPVERCYVYRPEKRSDVARVLSSGNYSFFISGGLGRSYGDAALNRGNGIISHLRLNRFLGFDSGTAVLECESGVSLAEIIETFLPRGFFLPVTPGTKYVTVGGAIASDVHGKNHHVDGTFAEFLVDFQLQSCTGEIFTCSREERPEVFWATVGGMGLTGAILSARIRLRPVEAAYVRADYRKTQNLDDALCAFAESDDDYRYSVAWIDGLASGASLGRSILMRANDATADELRSKTPLQDPLSVRKRRSAAISFDFPSITLNRASIQAFNTLYYRKQRNATAVLVDYESFFYPLDSIGNWNRLYGRRGFVQYQTALPLEGGREGLIALLERLSAAKRASFLAVLKRFGKANPGLLSFPFEGYTLALDLPNRPGLQAFLGELDQITLRYGGRVYLAKDAALTPEAFSAMYPEVEEFRRIKREVDPQGRFSSSLARRIGLV